jgi:CRP/FNR family transcriptional regulator, carbon monoxide oxidation system transcription regulator
LRYEAYRSQPDAAGVPCFSHGLSVEQLATIVGASRQTVSSLLNALEREGIVELRARGVIRILDPAALEGLADS